MGLLSYLARGVEETGVREVQLVPVSIVYDRLNEVVQMTAESRGAKKQPEGFRWMMGYIHSQRGQLGRIQVRFGEPLSLEAALGGARGEERALALSKAAFEVCTRINRATPVTATALTTLALLGADGWAVTLDQVVSGVRPLIDYVTRRRLPGADAIGELKTRRGMRRVLRVLIDGGVVDEFTDGAEAVYRISPERELAAAFYRNINIHWFVNRAIIELSLVAAAEAPGEDPMGVAIEDALRLRDLLKFEFFFSGKAEFQGELREEFDLIAPQWRRDDGAIVSSLGEAIGASGGLVADRVLRSFLEAYWVVADRLASVGDEIVDSDTFIRSCLGVVRQYQLQRRIVSGEANSVELFKNGLQLAANRGLCDPDNPDRAQGRLALADELHDLLRRLELLTRWEQEHRLRREGDRDSRGRAAVPS